VVTSASVNFTNGEAIQFTTTGSLPTGLFVGTIYYVVNASASTCNVSAIYNGTAINTTAAGSGTHYLLPRGIDITSLGGSTGAPTVQNTLIISDASRFLFAFGCNEIGSTVQDPMLIRWCDQESLINWSPSGTNQAGSLRLSHGSEIVCAMQARQEILVWTDSSLYSIQYLGATSGVWGSQLMGDNLSIMSQNATAYANGVAYWMGVDKFYKYDGRTQTLICDLRQFVFENINKNQLDQVFGTTNEGFNEIWFFYCSIPGPTGTGTPTTPNTLVDTYVIYNYAEDVWYYGSMGRTAWMDSGLQNYPIGATYSYNLVQHENGLNDCTDSDSGVAIESYINSAQFDIDDGNNFGFIWRMLPDLTFSGSDAAPTPAVTYTLYPMVNSGSGTGTAVAAGVNKLTGASYTITEGFTGQVFTRVRGRQMILKVGSNQLGVQWQLGATRIDIRPDGRR
jgi:hypothetical protein